MALHERVKSVWGGGRGLRDRVAHSGIPVCV